MKKLFSILLAVSMLLTATLLLTACNEGDDGLTEAEWQAMLAAPNFENYTFRQSATLNYSGASGNATIDQDVIIKITADMMTITDQLGQGLNATFEGDELDEQRGAYEDVFLALLADFDNFAYDADTATYKTNSTISLDLDLQSEGLTAKITMKDGVVTLTEDGKLAKFSCHFTQEMTVPGVGDITVIAPDMTWSFSAYGTTVIDAE